MDSLLKRIEADWRNALRRVALLNALAISLLMGAWAWRVLSEIDAMIIAATSLAAFFALFSVKRQITTQSVIRELNRRPECEHSAELLLRSPDELPFLARLQRRNIERWLEKQNPKTVIPNDWRNGWSWLVASVLASMVIVAIPKTPSERGASPEEVAPSLAPAIRIEQIEVQIEPPAYALKPKRVQSSLDIVAEENATARWTLKLDREREQVALAMSSGDTIRFKRETPRLYRAEMKIERSQIYALAIDDFVSEAATIDVQKDLPPVVSVLSPTSRVEFSSPDSATLFVRAAISDDYKVRAVRLVVTTAKGKGEAVKFKSDTTRLYAKGTLENGIERYETTIDLKRYGLTYGDECYFFIEATDNREPKPNRTRSETCFAKILDTLQTFASENVATPVLRLPAYFRSQRQIIIDTEKLVAEKKSLDPIQFRARSENLGIEQKILRLRYGKFLGEEFAMSVGETENERLAKTMRDTSTNPIVKLQKQAAARVPKADDGHQHDEQTQSAQSLDALAEPYMHRHDIKEAATFFSESIKQTLKAALAEMWEAEKFLRLAQPERALPFEYKALQLLKELQRQARVYVEKSGFEPTPIDEARLRLTGDVAKANSTRIAQTLDRDDSLAAIKAALDILNDAKKPLSNIDLETLEEAGMRFAQLAVENNLKHLSALQALRELIADAKAGRARSEKNIRVVQRAFVDALPAPYQLPKPQNSARSPLAARYFQSLNETP